jgi:hypothetical protein
MTPREAIYARMNTDTELKAMVSGIFQNVAPKTAGDNIITYSRIGEKSVNRIIGIMLYQVSVWCKDIVQGDKIKTRLEQLFDKRQDSENSIEYCFVESVDDLFYPEHEEYGIHLTLRIKTLKSQSTL